MQKLSGRRKSMKVTLSADHVKPYMIKKINHLKELVEVLNEELEQADEAYNKKLSKYEQKHPLIRFLTSKPEHPDKGFISGYTIVKIRKEDIEKKINRISYLISSLKHATKIELDEKDIAYYEII
ncbi:hypothetical protein M3Y14_34295 (plasmid) [Bacillus thuringiensis]|uniref:hypothetical protein n=1 Tax=Bacillus thuringiensis TaxID=1428 RepID=UPI0022248781|nr:hypothetical protein [Bacillus thuringiensis]UYX56054.1 hypothetical protein M3Y14_34295 [Bacillus thuringiensis]